MSDVTWTPTTIPLRALTPWERNPKRISKAHAARLLELWDELGQFQTIAIGPAGEVYDGHQRLSVLKAAHGGKYEVTALQSSRALSEKEREKLTVAAHVGTVGAFDWDALSGWDAGDLQAWGFDTETLTNWQTDIGALRTMLDAEQAPMGDDPGAQVDKAAELREKWDVHPGQLWALGEHRLVCGDCTDAVVVERVMGGERAALFATDPPYGANAGNIGFTAQRDELELITNDDLVDTTMQRWLETVFRTWVPVLNENAAWYLWHPMLTQGYFAAAAAAAAVIIHRQIIWVKEQFIFGRGDYHWQHELCFFGWIQGHRPPFYGERNQSTVWNVPWGVKRSEIGHPTAKPPELWDAPIRNHTKPGEICAEPFCGSGAQIIACERLGRRCRAVEIEPGYVAVALERWATMTGKTPVLLDGGDNG